MIILDDPRRILDADVVGLDTETTGLHPPRDRAFGVSLWSRHGGGYFDLRRDYERLRDALRDFGGLFVAHNASFDFRSLHSAGIELAPERFDDTAVRAALIYEHHFSYQLDALAKACLKKSKQSEIYTKLAEIFGGRATRNVQMKNLPDAPPEVVAEYAIVDAQLVYELWHWQEKQIAIQGLRQVAEFERAKMPALFRMALAGIRVDLERAERSAEELTPIIESNLRQLEAAAGFEINVNAPKDVARLFDPVPDEATGAFRSKWGDPIPATDSGAPSMAAPALRSMSSPIARLVVDTRSLIKTRDTFLRGHVIGHSFAGRVFPSINQSKTDAGAGTGTGRLSYTDPALQQIPSRNRRVAELVKSVFLPEEGQVWADADLASFEVRVFAHFAAANNPAVAQAYKDNPELDFHQYVADLTGLPRSPQVGGGANAKQLNLCLGTGTEYLSPSGWKRIEEYDGGQVAQWSGGEVSFVDPLAYYSGHSEDVYEMRAKWGTLVATGNHRMPVWSPQKNGYKVVDRFVGEMSEVPNRSFSLVTQWEHSGDGVGWTDEELRLAVAFQADGINSGGSKNAPSESFIFSRPRKIERIRKLLLDAGLRFSEGTLKSGAVRFGILRDQRFTGHHGKTERHKWSIKKFSDVWSVWNLSSHQKVVILDEIRYWDGTESKGTVTYCTSTKDNADFIQLIALSCGIETSVNVTDFNTEKWSRHYRVRIGLTRRRSVMSYNINKTYPQPVYCFTVPSGYFLCRTREGQVLVTGNSMIFNSGNGAVAEQMGLPWEWATFMDHKSGQVIRYKKAGPRALEVIAQYHTDLPGVKQFAENARAAVVRRASIEGMGYVTTRTGRKIRFPDTKKAYKASGLLIQSTAAELNKVFIERLESECRQVGGRLLLNTHDSYSMSLPRERVGDHAARMKAAVETGVDWLRVPIVLEINHPSNNWYGSWSADRMI